MTWSKAARAGLTFALTGLAAVYILSKIDPRQTVEILRDADFAYVALSLAISLAAFPANAWRWQLLLRAKGVDERLGWLTRAYVVSYTAGQVLPSSLGADAVRIYETVRRHPTMSGPVAASILLERALGGVATLLLAAIGFLLAVGRYDVGVYIWVELAFVALAAVAAFVVFSQRARPLLRRTAPMLKRVRVEHHVRSVYQAIHAYRGNVALLAAVAGVGLLVQAGGVIAIWASGMAVGIDLSPRPYFVMAPLLVLLVLVPFTVGGLGVRESFFVSFLGQLSVGADIAFSASLVFLVVILAAALPGLIVLPFEAFTRRAPSRAADGGASGVDVSRD